MMRLKRLSLLWTLAALPALMDLGESSTSIVGASLLLISHKLLVICSFSKWKGSTLSLVRSCVSSITSFLPFWSIL
ncbi:hypothetical protein ACS0TY_006238 [Phlomoides rotata]